MYSLQQIFLQELISEPIKPKHYISLQLLGVSQPLTGVNPVFAALAAQVVTLL